MAAAPLPSVPGPPSRLPAVVRAVLWLSITMACFIGMMIAARRLTTEMSVFEVMFFRNAIGLLVLAPFVFRRGIAGLATTRMRIHAGRAAVQFGAQYSWIYGVAMLPLAEVTALEYTVPIWTAILALPILRERMTAHRWVATIFGFAGVLVILRPGLAAVSPAAIVVLTGCAGFALNHVLVKYLTRTDKPEVIVFYMNLFQLPIALAPALFVWTTPSWAEVPWIVAFGSAGLVANYAMARALRLVDATVLAPIDFLRLPFTALAAYLLYAEALSPWTALGALVIFSANYHSLRREAKKPAPQ